MNNLLIIILFICGIATCSVIGIEMDRLDSIESHLNVLAHAHQNLQYQVDVLTEKIK